MVGVELLVVGDAVLDLGAEPAVEPLPDVEPFSMAPDPGVDPVPSGV